MIDTYLAATDEAAFRAFLSYFTQVIGPQAYVANEGDQPVFYACVRAPFPVPVMPGIDVVVAEVGQSIVGVWA